MGEMTGTWKDGLRGAWLVAIGLALYVVADRVALRWGQSLRVANDYPGHTPPWYFIRRDAITGGLYAAALVLSLTAAFLGRRKYPAYAGMLAWMSVLWFGGGVFKWLVILASTRDVLEGGASTTRWTTFDSYLGDPVITAGQIGVYVFAILIAIASIRVTRRAAAAA
jgi:hypothetical protein